MSPFAIILWLWLGVSISVYLYRLYRRAMRSSNPSLEAQPTDSEAPRDPSKPLGAASALIQNPVAGFESPAGPSAPSADPATISQPTTPPTAPAGFGPPPVPSVPPAPPVTPIPPAIPTSWAAPAPGEMSASERRTSRVPVSEAVSGIQLPCDLAPLVGDASRLDLFDAAFFTTTHDGDSVRGALAGELVRLGFQVSTTSTYRLAASRPDAELAVTIFPAPRAATEAGRPLYPTAAQGSVVVRFQT